MPEESRTTDFDWGNVRLRYTDAFTKFWKPVGHIQTVMGVLDIMQGRNSWIIGQLHSRDDVPDDREFRVVLRVDGEANGARIVYAASNISRLIGSNERP